MVDTLTGYRIKCFFCFFLISILFNGGRDWECLKSVVPPISLRGASSGDKRGSRGLIMHLYAYVFSTLGYDVIP